MLFDRDLKGDRLPEKTLCLTYDDGPGQTAGDGPGPHTLELGHYLYEHKIRAAFFVIGKHAREEPNTLAQLQAWGHIIGNHTFNHPGLVATAQQPAEVIKEIAQTDAIIRDFVSSETVFLRPPYGNWREKRASDPQQDKTSSIVADILNRSGQFNHYVGPINWDISAADYDFWKRAAPAEECAQAYLRKIETKRKGIVLMHDSSNLEEIRTGNRTLETTKLIVPVLKNEGFRFVGLDSIPQVQSAQRVSFQLTLMTRQGEYLACTGECDDLALRPLAEPLWRAFGVVQLQGNKIALRASNGQYVSVRSNQRGEVSATGVSLGEAETLEMEPVEAGQVALRTAKGLYWTRDSDRADKIIARNPCLREAEVFVLRRLFEEPQVGLF
ncbi:MAG: polysaccharide deacetylase family protein [Gemmataceae bacterium]